MGYRREDTKKNKDEQKRRIKNRYNVTIDESNYRFFPAKKQLDYYDNDVPQRVAVYARVSTDNVAQTTSYELQRKYYEEFVTRHPNWTLVHMTLIKLMKTLLNSNKSLAILKLLLLLRVSMI